MALAAAHARLFHFGSRKCAHGKDLHVACQTQESFDDLSFQRHVRAGIIAQDDRHGTIAAQRRLPAFRIEIAPNQAAFLRRTPPIKILVIKAALLTVECFHPHPQPLPVLRQERGHKGTAHQISRWAFDISRTRGLCRNLKFDICLHPRHILARACINPDRVTLVHKEWHLDTVARLDRDILVRAGGGIATHGHFGLDDF